MVTISGLCSHIQKSSERSRLCASCDKKEADCTRASAANTFDLKQISDGVHGCVQVRARGPDFYRYSSEDKWRILP